MSIFTLFTSLSPVRQVSIEELPLQTLPVSNWRPTERMGLQHTPGLPHLHSQISVADRVWRGAADAWPAARDWWRGKHACIGLSLIAEPKHDMRI